MQFRRNLRPMVAVDLVPMIDIVFQLVVFFMLSSTLVARTGLNLDLPNAESGEETVTSAVVLSVISMDEIYLADERHTIESLDAVLAERRERFEGRAISIEADSSLPYGTMVAVLDVLRRNGFRGANLVAEEAPARVGGSPGSGNQAASGGGVQPSEEAP